MAEIPVRNIYALLAFAGRDIGLLDDNAIGACDFDGPYDVLARLLDASMRRIFSRGLHRRYREEDQQGPKPRGALDLGRTVGALLHIRGELAFRVDERVPDTAPNRVLKAALRGLLRDATVDRAVKTHLRRHFGRLSGVGDVAPGTALVERTDVPRGLQVYRPALLVARLCQARMLPDEGQSGAQWRRLLESEDRMGELFEAFVRGFAHHTLSQTCKVGVRHLEWDRAGASTRGNALLPVMKTDVFLDWHHGPPTICECKFYRSPLAQHPQSAAAKLRSSHLYQLTAYLRAASRDSADPPAGLLLYATVDESVHETMVLEGFPLTIVTLDLARPWEELRRQLNAVLVAVRPPMAETATAS